MRIVDRGSGVPVVVIPGVQGRWEWMTPGIDALAQRSRVITFSLADEPSSGARFDEALGFWNYVDQVRDALDARGLDRAAICGVSYGGLIAAAFAIRYPERTSSVILASALHPSWRPDARRRRYMAMPWLYAPAFCVRSLRNLREIAAANDGMWNTAVAGVRHGVNVLRYSFHPGRMARRMSLLEQARIEEGLARVKVPALLLTGEDALDKIVPPPVTRQYLKAWPQARVETLVRTGHLGMITRPHEFASLVTRFLAESEKKIA